MIPIGSEEEVTSEWLFRRREYFSKWSLRLEGQADIEKLFNSKYAYAERVSWPNWRVNQFYGGPEARGSDELGDYVHITIYAAIGPVEPCRDCGVAYRYLDILDLKYKCACQIGQSAGQEDGRAAHPIEATTPEQWQEPQDNLECRLAERDE